VCRNCVKSKRECLGYDPVFRQQPGPSDIRPAANSQPALVVNPQENHNPYPSAPPGYVPASAQPFAPSVQSDSSVQSFDQPGNGNGNNTNTGSRQGPVEPSIEGSDTMSMMASLQDTVDGSLSQPMGTPDLSTPALLPFSGQVSRQGMLSMKKNASFKQC
jgi:white-opaque regulator 2